MGSRRAKRYRNSRRVLHQTPNRAGPLNAVSPGCRVPVKPTDPPVKPAVKLGFRQASRPARPRADRASTDRQPKLSSNSVAFDPANPDSVIAPKGYAAIGSKHRPAAHATKALEFHQPAHLRVDHLRSRSASLSGSEGCLQFALIILQRGPQSDKRSGIVSYRLRS